jgi:hypothetical protein
VLIRWLALRFRRHVGKCLEARQKLEMGEFRGCRRGVRLLVQTSGSRRSWREEAETEERQKRSAPTPRQAILPPGAHLNLLAEVPCRRRNPRICQFNDLWRRVSQMAAYISSLTLTRGDQQSSPIRLVMRSNSTTSSWPPRQVRLKLRSLRRPRPRFSDMRGGQVPLGGPLVERSSAPRLSLSSNYTNNQFTF